ncbi:outer membrane protein assembly factor BamB family protein [Dokdonella sp. MW10]|uniref:outer membrane protein assembly factor BamB family protein n=1 Tax=Dokdonella sp. MW10 TaxID=2992926 RepID=UPI003F81CCEC
MGIFKAAVYAAFGLAVSGSCAAATVWEHYPPLRNAGTSGIVIGDFDGDGRQDAVVTAGPDNQIGWVASNAQGRLSLRSLMALHPGTLTTSMSRFLGPLRLMPREGPSDRVIGIVSSDYSDASNEIVVFGGVPLRVLRTIPVPGVRKIATVADVDADGALEIVAVARAVNGSVDTPVILDYATGAQEWRGTLHTSDVAVAQLDNDPALELILTGMPGRIIDGATREEEWSWPDGFLSDILVGRFAGDQGAPTFAIRRSRDVQVFRSQPYGLIGQLPEPALRGAFVVRYAGADRLALDMYGSNIAIRDAVSGATLYSEHVPRLPMVNALSVADIDGDGRPEMIYGASGPTYGMLRVVDMVTRVDDYAEREELGPHAAIARGDFAGNGSDQVAFATVSTESNGRQGLHILDAGTGELLRSRPGEVDGRARGNPSLSVAQLDMDPQMEIVLVGDSIRGMSVAVFDGLTLEEQWRVGDFGGSGNAAHALVDTNADGTSDVVVGMESGHLVVFDGRDGTLLWQSVTISGDTPWSIETVASPPRIIASRGNGVYVFDASTKLLEAVAKTPRSIRAMSRWGEGAMCRLGLLDATSSLRIHACADLAFIHEWTLPPATTFFRALDAAGDHMVTVSDNVVHQARRGQSATAASAPLGLYSAFGNRGIVVPLEDGGHDVIVGTTHMVTRIRLDPDPIFSGDFE